MADGIFIDEDWKPFEPCFVYDAQLDVLTWLESDEITVAQPISTSTASRLIFRSMSVTQVSS